VITGAAPPPFVPMTGLRFAGFDNGRDDMVLNIPARRPGLDQLAAFGLWHDADETLLEICGERETTRCRFDRNGKKGKPEMSPAEGECLSALRRQVGETRRLFSNAQKPEREKMVCRAFLHSM
jgi:hypothetical protein